MIAIAITSERSVAPLPPGVSDKAAHAAGFGLLALLFVRAGCRGRWGSAGVRVLLMAWGLAAGYGIVDEWHQSMVPGRTTSVADWVADVLGAAAVVLAVVVTRALHPWKR